MDYAGDRLILLGMLWLKFHLFHESSEVQKDVSVNEQIGLLIRTVEGRHKSYGDEGRTKVRHLCQRFMSAGIFVMYFFYSGIT